MAFILAFVYLSCSPLSLTSLIVFLLWCRFWPYSVFVKTDTKERRWHHNTSDTGRISTTIACEVFIVLDAMTTTTATSRIGL